MSAAKSHKPSRPKSAQRRDPVVVVGEETSGDNVNMHIAVPRELHKKAKIYAITHGMTLKEFVLDAMEKRMAPIGTAR